MASAAIRFTQSANGPTPEMVTGFFVGWPNPPSAETLLRLLRNSEHVVLALHGERVIGLATAISDGVLSAYIPLLEVLPEFQSQGIGSQLIQRLLEQLENLYMIDLLCDPVLQQFYARLGFEPASGMMIRNRRVLTRAASPTS